MSEYLFEYPFRGHTYCMTVSADDECEAIEKAEAMGNATLQGRVAETIPAIRGWTPQIVNPDLPVE